MILARRKADQNKAAIDPWTAVHAGAGLGAGLMDIPFGPAMLGAIGYELFEQGFEASEAGQRLFKVSGPETPANAVVDVLIFAVGWWAGDRWNRS